MNSNRHTHTRSRQRGAALIVTLVLLVVITLLGLASLRQTALEERMSANLKDRSIALNSAEIGLRGGETWLTGQPAPLTDIDGLPKSGDTDYMQWQTSDWGSKGTAVTAGGVSPAPRYAAEYWDVDEADIEKRDKGMGTFYYRLTSYGQGGSGQTSVVLQEVKPMVFK